MWVLRELLRLISRIAVAVAIAILLAALLSLVSSGDFVHALRIMFFLIGALLILLAGAGSRSSAPSRRVNWRVFSGIRGYTAASPRYASRPGQPILTASAVFVGSGAALIVLGLAV